MTKFRSSLSGLLILDEPLFKSDLIGESAYFMNEDFDKGATPAGWTVSTNGSGSQVTYTQAYESKAIGQAYIQANQSTANNRAGIIYSQNNNLILRLDDGIYTRFNCHFRINNPASNMFIQFGLGNTITPANLNSFGNTIALRYDPTNRSGENPGLITNLLFFTKKSGVGYNVIDTGIAINSDWNSFDFIYDNQDSLNPKLFAYINRILVATITSMVNVPINITPAAGASIHPHAIIGNGFITGGSAQGFRVDKISTFKLFS